MLYLSICTSINVSFTTLILKAILSEQETTWRRKKSKPLCKFGTHIPLYPASYSRKWQSSSAPMWQLRSFHINFGFGNELQGEQTGEFEGRK